MYIAIRDNHLGMVAEPAEELRELNISSVEIFVGRDMKLQGCWGDITGDDPEDIETLKKGLTQNGIRVCALLMGNDFSSDDMASEIEWIMKTVELGKQVDCSTVRIDLAPHREISSEEFLERCITGMQEVMEKTEEDNTQFGIENHGRVSNNPEFLEQVFEGVGSDRLGLTLDTGNFYWYGWPLEEVYANMERFAGRVKHTHSKNINYPEDKQKARRDPGWEYKQYVSPIFEGDIDHQRVADILKRAGYNGDLCIEDESMGKCSSDEERFDVLKKDAEHLRACI